MFNEVDPKQSFPKLEEGLLKYWKENKTFEKSVENRSDDYIFYDGPPFATGLPHYGHLLAGTIKDVVPRYWTMRGKRIERRWGWDCHGLPVENEVEKELDLGSKGDIEEFGVDKFNEACRSVVLRYAEEWKKTVNRMGRWVDMENDYKTMNPEFMESVWSVFENIYSKGLVYEGHKVVPYCPRCATPLSNFETNQGYQDKQDPALTVKFELEGEEGTYFLAWTTTPWTLPSNLALAVGPELTYAKVKDNASGEMYILALDRVDNLYKDPSEYEILDKRLGKELEGKKYKPLLPYFEDKEEEKVFTVTTGDFVSLESGTGIVHMAPFGEDDMAVIQKLEIEPVHPLDAEGQFNYLVREFMGVSVFDANPEIIKKLKEENKVVKHETINHSYPFCWRCDTALIYRPISTWFVKVEEIKDSLLKTNQEINWVPGHIKEGRFGKWLEGARDWAISRNRYWGTPLPIWRSASGEIKVIGSIKELEELSGEKVEDIHKHKIDHINLPIENAEEVDITFVRHGETDWNKEHRWQGSTDNELNETGIEQAKAAAEQLKDEKFDLIITSPMKRAKKTAEIINEVLGLEMITESNLRERSYGIWEGKKSDDLCKEYNAKDYGELRLMTPKGGESMQTVINRVDSVYGKYLGKKILVVGHGHVLFSTQHLCLDEPLEVVSKLERKNAVPYEYTYKDSYKRVPEVFDCWFESGSMPYAQLHYPFENKEKFENNFPAEFIAEGLDQTRGWFYTLHILANGQFKRPAFKNCIVNGIVLAEDGKKMSKRLKNYPDPGLIMDKYGADAMRFYLMNSPVVNGGDIRFSEKGVEDVVRNFILPIWNAYSFFVTYANIDKWDPKDITTSDNKLDQWILSRLNKLIQKETQYMEAYDLQKSSNEIYEFVDDLTNWYIRRSRRRFWKSEDDKDKNAAYSTLFTALTKLTQVVAPFVPFVAEEIYMNLTKEESVHLSDYPEADEKLIDDQLEQEIGMAKTIVSLGLAARAKKKIKVRQPLSKVQVALGDQYDASLLEASLETIQEELNIKEVELVKDASSLATVIAKPNAKLLGPKYGKDMQSIIQTAKAGNFEKLDNGNIKVLDFELTPEEIEIAYMGAEGVDVETAAGILVALDTTITPELEEEGLARDLVRQIQELRKDAGYNVDDRIQLAIIGAEESLIKNFGGFIQNETLAESIEGDLEDADSFTQYEGITIKVKR